MLIHYSDRAYRPDTWEDKGIEFDIKDYSREYIRSEYRHLRRLGVPSYSARGVVLRLLIAAGVER